MTFLGPQWDKMIEWFNNDPLARTIKYFVLSGDGVDGVGFILDKIAIFQLKTCSINTQSLPDCLRGFRIGSM